MSLHITILECHAQPLNSIAPPVVIEKAGSIGRSPENDLVLPDDPAISRTHARISFTDSQFIYEDTSTNGSTCADDHALIHRSTVAITEGMRMRLGQYLLSFSITQDIPKENETASIPTGFSEQREIPPLPSRESISPSTTTTHAKGMDAADESDLINVIFKSAGLQICHPDNPVLARVTADRIGKLLKSYTQGLKKALDARAVVKDELHAARTLLGARDNNPLKFIQQDTDSLQELLFGHESSYRVAESAVEEAFNDLISHEMALFAAIQLSAKHVIHRFHPKEVEDSVSGGIGFQRKMKCWDAYCDAFPQMAETALDDLLGKAFLQAYEDQLIKLKNNR